MTPAVRVRREDPRAFGLTDAPLLQHGEQIAEFETNNVANIDGRTASKTVQQLSSFQHLLKN